MSRGKKLILTFLLSLPLVAFVVHHYTAHSPELHPTGFTVDENVLYMSYAHQYLDEGHFTMGYSNPFDGDPGSPHIYFQPATLLMGAALKAGADPGLAFTLFGLLMAMCCIYLGILLLEHLLPDKKYLVITSILFTWGGGLTAITGIAAGIISGMPVQSWRDAIYIADPANGWWGLNWGRTLFIPLEAFYHFLFLLTLLYVLKKRWKHALFSAFIISVSHPFTGIEFLLIICGWLGLEKIIWRNKAIPGWFFAGNILLLLLHVGYYLFYLNSFAAHRQLFNQYSASWTHSFRVFIPAYLLVLLLALFTARIKNKSTNFLSKPDQRLFICWALISFLLSKHEWFIRPMQPLHFTRGYTWAGLFLFALPGIIWLIQWGKRSLVRRSLYASIIVLLMVDNTLWVYNQLREKATTEWEGHLSADTKAVLHFLGENTNSNHLLTGNSRLVNYMANVYSAANAWYSHPYNTPDIEKRKSEMEIYFSSGVRPAAWNGRHVLIVLDKRLSAQPAMKERNIYENNSYRIIDTE